MSKHTPGPWNIEPYGNNRQLVIGVYPNDSLAAEVEGPNRVADAHLIAAAPDLLALLQQHLDWFDGKFLPVDEVAFIEATRATIAKARGDE